MCKRIEHNCFTSAIVVSMHYLISKRAISFLREYYATIIALFLSFEKNKRLVVNIRWSDWKRQRSKDWSVFGFEAYSIK